MIRINLLGEKEDRSGIYILQLLAAGGLTLLTLLACFQFQQSQENEVEILVKRKGFLEVQATKLREKTKLVDMLEKNKKILAEKLMTIAKLKAKKQGPVRVLDDLTRIIPERAWFTGVEQKGEQIEFKGIALDNQTVAQFMDNLKRSKYFHGEDLRVSKQYVRDGVKLQQFHVLARLTSMLQLTEGKEGTTGKNEVVSH